MLIYIKFLYSTVVQFLFPKIETKKTPKKTTKGTKRSKSKKLLDDEISDIDSEDDEEEEEEEEEPSSKKPKKMPTDEELKKTVLGLLDNVDLEKVTMKNVLQQVTCFASALFLFIFCFPPPCASFISILRLYVISLTRNVFLDPKLKWNI